MKKIPLLIALMAFIQMASFAQIPKLPSGLTVNDMHVNEADDVWIAGHDDNLRCGFLAHFKARDAYENNTTVEYYYTADPVVSAPLPGQRWLDSRLDGFDKVKSFVDGEGAQHVVMVALLVRDTTTSQGIIEGSDTTSIFVDFKPESNEIDFVYSTDTMVVFDDAVVLQDYVVAVSRLILNNDSITSLRIIPKSDFSLRVPSYRNLSLHPRNPDHYSKMGNTFYPNKSDLKQFSLPMSMYTIASNTQSHE